MVRVNTYRHSIWNSVAAQNPDAETGRGTQPPGAPDVDHLARDCQDDGVNRHGDDTAEYIRRLEEELPGREIVIADVEGKDEIQKYALSHKGSYQIVISQKALEKMMSDPDFEKKCLDSLRQARYEQAEKISALPPQGKMFSGCGLLVGEDGGISQWVLSFQKSSGQKRQYWGGILQTPDAGEKYTSFKTKNGIVRMEKKKPGYIPARDLVKIARAANRQAVRRTMSGIKAQIYQLKSGGGERRVKAVLVKQAEQVLLKAKVKEKQLSKEEILNLQQKRARQKAEYEKSLRLKLLLKRKREGRKVREYGQIRDYYATPLEKMLEKEQDRLDRAAASECGGVTGTAYVPAAGMEMPVMNGDADVNAGMTLDITIA